MLQEDQLTTEQRIPEVISPALSPRGAISSDVRRALNDAQKAHWSENTIKTYQSAMEYIAAWYRVRFGQGTLTLPVTPSVVITFITDHVPVRVGDGHWITTLPPDIAQVLVEQELRKPETRCTLAGMRRYIAALKWAHAKESTKHLEWASPFDDTQVIAKLRKLPTEIAAMERAAERAPKSAAKRSATALAASLELARSSAVMSAPRQRSSRRGQGKKTAIRAEDLQAIIEVCEADLAATRLDTESERDARDRVLRASRDRALVLFGWSSGGRRRSEIADAHHDGLTEASVDGEPVFLYSVGWSKTNQAGHPTDAKPVVGRAYTALRHWLDLCGDDRSGLIFRKIVQGRIGASLCDRTVARIIQQRATQAGLVGNFGGHSLRSGFVSEAITNRIADAEAMRMTEHRSVQQYNSYYQIDSLLQTEAARLLENSLAAGAARRAAKKR